jgi:hypothetical protein
MELPSPVLGDLLQTNDTALHDLSLQAEPPLLNIVFTSFHGYKLLTSNLPMMRRKRRRGSKYRGSLKGMLDGVERELERTL